MRIKRGYEYLCSKTDKRPAIGLILGSGLGDFGDELDNRIEIPFEDIPAFPVATVMGHKGAFVFGTYNGANVVALRGRIHYYEGYSQQEITMPVRIMKLLGVKTLIITNACGGINAGFPVGGIMQITDHINYSGQNPLIGHNLDSFGPRFPDMSDIYTKELRAEFRARAEKSGVETLEGVYCMYSGPSFETPAEIRFMRGMGADAVGMSTVPEAIIARHAGMNVMGFACVANMAAGMLDQPLTHDEVMDTTNRIKSQFKKVVSLAIEVANDLVK